ncbi:MULTISPECIES: DUF4041 domain-containing protein [Halomonas]|uniref:DUF4041 domain-containing protein n=1 Tax=Halomonas TaxID=2745 RepID=UPI001C979A92|nr:MULTISPECIES: DUF4041 domain-containing protein [Halomonas]MBY6207822.1 DUF4041 domain-containing protein [Halomonas sp. DP3Y7-2]MBY6228631.1 DUF4041 domain-containing protein [Halomonas sp. DP3Y7-1]MCA0916697.1 DUF4041 domain-containing protein [Halomonas denitrificans]
MDVTIIGSALIIYFASLGMVYLLTRKRANNKIQRYKSISEAINTATIEQQQVEKTLTDVLERLKKANKTLQIIDADTKDLQALRSDATSIAAQLKKDKKALDEIEALISQRQETVDAKEALLNGLMSKLDLYSRLDEYVEYGHFEMPEYLFETGERFSAEIKILREKQKAMIKNGTAFTQEGEVSLTGDNRVDKKIIDGQMKMILRAFNIECDMLIGKVSPSNFDRTLGQIEKLANDLEKLAASLRCGISIDYVTSKYEECGIQYQYTLKKKDEQEEQKLIREQMREEARAEKEYRDALAAAQKEEKLYRDILEKAQEELIQSSAEERALIEAKISELEQRLAEAEAKEQRAKSLAEQTRRGHVYVISNIGSFGENVYKIGMTRRLDPMDRVKELGDASVPFPFDVHAIIYSDDAPAMETTLHRKFRNHRVNAVNLRKEFFRVRLDTIRDAVEEIGGEEVGFKKTIVAEEFFETNRLRESSAA